MGLTLRISIRLQVLLINSVSITDLPWRARRADQARWRSRLSAQRGKHAVDRRLLSESYILALPGINQSAVGAVGALFDPRQQFSGQHANADELDRIAPPVPPSVCINATAGGIIPAPAGAAQTISIGVERAVGLNNRPRRAGRAAQIACIQMLLIFVNLFTKSLCLSIASIFADTEARHLRCPRQAVPPEHAYWSGIRPNAALPDAGWPHRRPSSRHNGRWDIRIQCGQLWLSFLTIIPRQIVQLFHASVRVVWRPQFTL